MKSHFSLFLCYPGPAKTVAKVLGSSRMTVSGSFSVADERLRGSLFLGGDVDVTLAANAVIRARIGKSLFGRCFKKSKNEFPLAVLSRGSVWIGAQIFAEDVRIEDRTNAPNGYGVPPVYNRVPKQVGGKTQKFLVFRIRIREEWNKHA